MLLRYRVMFETTVTMVGEHDGPFADGWYHKSVESNRLANLRHEIEYRRTLGNVRNVKYFSRKQVPWKQLAEGQK